MEIVLLRLACNCMESTAPSTISVKTPPSQSDPPINASRRQRGSTEYKEELLRKRNKSDGGRNEWYTRNHCSIQSTSIFYNEDNDYYIFNEAKRPKYK